MSDSLRPFAATTSGDLQEEVRQLRSLVGLSLMGSLIVSLSLGAYIYKQFSQLRREVTSRRETVAHIPEENRKMSAFVAQLKQFGRTYPDFADVLKKYSLKDDEAAASPAPATGTVPAPVKK